MTIFYPMSSNELVEKNADVVVTSTLPEVPENFESTVEKSCENCHQPIDGPFCGQCGQQAESTLKYFWVVIMHLLDDIFSFDSRAARTISPLVTRPGFLTNEYFAGRRVHYVPPLRLYLFISIIFFITLKFFVASESSNILNVNDNQTVITKIKSHIDSLKEQQLSAKDQQEPNLDELLKSLNPSHEEEKDDDLDDILRQMFGGQGGFSQQQPQQAPKVNPQEPSIDFDDDIPF